MSTTVTRAAFEKWAQKEGYNVSPQMETGRYWDSHVEARWQSWQAATEAAKAESQDDNKPAMYCVPDKDGKPLFGKGWMFSPIPHLAATMPLYTRPAAKATGTAGEQVGTICHTGDVEAVAEAIFKVMKPSNMIDRDWKSGAILGFENSFRDQVKAAARAAIEAARQPAPVVVKDLTDKEIDALAEPLINYESGDRISYYKVRAIVRAALAATNRSQP